MAQFRLGVKGHVVGDVWNSTLHVDNAFVGNSPLDALNAWRTALQALWDNGSGTGQGLHALISATVGIDEIDAVQLDPATGRNMDRAEAVLQLVGDGADASLPFQCSLCVSFRTSKATRAGRGRMYLPPFTTGTQSGGRITGEVQNQVLAAITAMFNSLNTALYKPVVYHRAKKAGTPPVIVTAPSFDTIVSWDVGDVIDTQRRRRNKLVEARASAA